MKAHCNYISAALGRSVKITVVIPSPVFSETLSFRKEPPVYTPKHRYPVIYLFHGIGNDGETWLDYTQAELFAEENNIAIVCFSGENKFYADNSSEKWHEFITEELPAFICGYFPVSPLPSDTFLCGLSMGGYGAMLNYLKSPERYGCVGCFSGAFDKFEFAQTEAGKEYNLNRLIEMRARENLKFVPLYIACGENDFIRDSSEDLKRTLEKNGVDFTWVSEQGYGHEWRFWNEQLEKFIKWLPRSDYYAGKTRKV